MHNLIFCSPLLSAHCVAEALEDCFVDFAMTLCLLGTISCWTSPSLPNNTINMVSTLDLTCRASLVEEMICALFQSHIRTPSFHHQPLSVTWNLCCLLLAHEGQCKWTTTRPSGLQSGSEQQFSFHPSRVHILLTILWQLLIDIPRSYATSLVVISLSARVISCIHATISLVWEVDGLNFKE